MNPREIARSVDVAATQRFFQRRQWVEATFWCVVIVALAGAGTWVAVTLMGSVPHLYL